MNPMVGRMLMRSMAARGKSSNIKGAYGARTYQISTFLIGNCTTCRPPSKMSRQNISGSIGSFPVNLINRDELDRSVNSPDGRI